MLEIGGGVGNLTLQLVPRWTFVVSDINPLYLQTLHSLRHQRPYLDVQYCDVTDLSTFPRSREGYDTVICLNVIEHVVEDREALENIRSVTFAGWSGDHPRAAGSVEFRHAGRGAGAPSAVPPRIAYQPGPKQWFQG